MSFSVSSFKKGAMEFFSKLKASAEKLKGLLIVCTAFSCRLCNVIAAKGALIVVILSGGGINNVCCSIVLMSVTLTTLFSCENHVA